MYTYIQSEPNLWTVGHYLPDGTWDSESDHYTPELAARRVHYLNGGCGPECDPPSSPESDDRATIEEIADRHGGLDVAPEPMTTFEIERLTDDHQAEGDPAPEVINDEGVISVMTYEARGDGGPVPWLKLVGPIGEIRREWAEVDSQATPEVKCDNCGWEGMENVVVAGFADIPHLIERLDPGGVVPFGECPNCDALCYPTE